MHHYQSPRPATIHGPLTSAAGLGALRLRGVTERLRAVDRLLAVALRLAGGLLTGGQTALDRARRRRLALRDLRALDDHLLADIGLSRPLLGGLASDLARAGHVDGRRRPCDRARAANRNRCASRLALCPAVQS